MQNTLASSYSIKQRQFGALNVDDFTAAPQRVIAKANFNAAAAIVFAKLADHESMHQWMPMIKDTVSFDHCGSKIPGQCDVGSVRMSNFGGDMLRETIKYWEPGKCYAYAAVPDKKLPAVDHLSVITVESAGENSSIVSWRQFFNPKPWSIQAKLMPFIMRSILAGALKNLAKEFGGGLVK